MGIFMITNRHRPNECSELADEMSAHYDAARPAGTLNVYRSCGGGEHRMFFFVEADGVAEAMHTVPPSFLYSEKAGGYLRGTNSIVQVEHAYSYAR